MWNQTFVYSGLRRADLRQRALEITVWDYVRYGANDFLGESIVELWPLDEQPTWRTLGPHEEVALTPSEHLSPPSTGSRFSDSDTPSECEIDGGRERRGADGASVSSVGSSSSPPNERKSRRDQETMNAYATQGYRRVSMPRAASAAPTMPRSPLCRAACRASARTPPPPATLPARTCRAPAPSRPGAPPPTTVPCRRPSPSPITRQQLTSCLVSNPARRRQPRPARRRNVNCPKCPKRWREPSRSASLKTSTRTGSTGCATSIRTGARARDGSGGTVD